MPEIIDVPVNLEVPSDRVRIVALQPFLPLAPPAPFKLQHGIDRHQRAITHALDLARTGFEGQGANFTLFPEYTIPGIRGAQAIHEDIQRPEWPNSTVVIGGVDGLTKEHYERLYETLAATVADENHPAQVQDGQWVNCCVTWIRDQDGNVGTWLQPKIRAALPELEAQHRDMFSGRAVHVFRARYSRDRVPCRFFTLVCYDWIAGGGEGSVVQTVLHRLDEQCRGNGREVSLDMVFIVQHNEEPNNVAFLNSTHSFLTNRNVCPSVRRDDAIICHVNTAADRSPKRTGAYGFTSCTLSPRTWFSSPPARPTVCLTPEYLRGTNTLKPCRDIVFREMGECIHLFALRVPRFVDANVGDRTLSIPLAEVYPVEESGDPRLPSGPVTADVKWLNDSLDELEDFSTRALNGRPLEMAARGADGTVRGQIRELTAPGLAIDFVNSATCNRARKRPVREPDRINNPDLWEDHEKDALEHAYYSLTGLSLGYHIDIRPGTPHAMLVRDDASPVRVITIRGSTHQDCREHFDTLKPPVNDPVLVVARNQDNDTPSPEEFATIFERPNEEHLRFLPYDSLRAFCAKSEDLVALKGELDAFIPRDHRFV